MDLREPFLGGVDNCGSPGLRDTRKKSDYPILNLISSQRTSSPDPFSTGLCSSVDQGRGGGEFQVGSVPSRPFVSPRTAPSSPTSNSPGVWSFSTPELLAGIRSLRGIPEEPHHVPEQEPYSSEAGDEEQGNEPDSEAPSSIEERNARGDEADGNGGGLGEPLTDDAQDEKEDKFSWASGLKGLLLSVPLLPSLPDVLNPFSRAPDDDDDDDFFPRCSSCKQYHGSDYKHGLVDYKPEEEQNGLTTPKRSGAIRDLFYPTVAPRHSLPDLVNPNFADDEHSLYLSVPVASPRAPAKVFPIDEDAEVLAPYAPVSGPGLLHQYVGKRALRKCKTAPMLTGFVNFRKGTEGNKRNATAVPRKTASSVVWQATMGLCLYLSLGVVVFTWKKKEFSGIETVGVIDALYFCIVTMCTIGYGDITPITPSAKLLSCALVFVGFGFIDALMSGMVTFVLDRQEHLLLTVMDDGHHEKTKNVIVDAKKGRMRIRMKVALAVGTVLSALTVGAIVLHYMEDLSWIDSIYASCISITTVGYGDVSFETATGRLFAAVWLLFGTLGVARAFLFLAEARVHSRHRRLAKRVLQRKMTRNDLMAMDLDNDGRVRKSEFVVYKLKEMGKIRENDIAEICKQFDGIDIANAGRITLSQLLEADG